MFKEIDLWLKSLVLHNKNKIDSFESSLINTNYNTISVN